MSKDSRDRKQAVADALRATGLQKEMKVQLRAKIIARIKEPSSSPVQERSLTDRVLQCLILEHLESKQLLKARSLLCAEAGVEGELARAQLQQLFGEKAVPGRSCLQSLLAKRLSFQRQFRESCTQTREQERSSIPENKPQRRCEHSVQEFEQKVGRFKLQLQQKLLREKDYQIQRVKDFVAGAVRLEEQARYHKQIEEYRRGLQQQLQTQRTRTRTALREQEQSLENRIMQLRTKELQVNQFLRRQKDLLRTKQQDLQRNQQQRQQFLERQEQRLEQLEQTVRKRLRQAELQEKLFASKVEEEAEAKLRVKMIEAKKRQLDFSAKEKEIEQSYFKLKNVEAATATFTAEIQRLSEENERLREDGRKVREAEQKMSAQLTKTMALLQASDARRHNYDDKLTNLARLVEEAKVAKPHSKELSEVQALMKALSQRVEELAGALAPSTEQAQEIGLGNSVVDEGRARIQQMRLMRQKEIEQMRRQLQQNERELQQLQGQGTVSGLN